MFTGLIEEVGRVRAVRRHAGGVGLEISAQTVLVGSKVGDSIAVDGVCLTVTALDQGGFSADVMAETLASSGLGSLAPGHVVNLERALRLSDRLGGHLVSGHVDGLAQLRRRRPDGSAVVFEFSCPPELLRYIALKGSVSIDGVSLTICALNADGFSVSLIPHSLANSTLSECRPGQAVNLECDLMAKYADRLLACDENKTLRLKRLLSADVYQPGSSYGYN
ncbi:MAG: riboflavin synthase subunit alpha [Spirochaetes bacterium GWD1_61_31]|nr:MAG: riboflavin synthase subunit alpha [Spirochaetes bacterium GWB1_60_80]OHD37793.1 MAG: riboflavin synthase subunit alpha [Spirochaetes bacterium GWD1_61_31]OHD42736.1 MAG: riboflavin synthase subunit alpha [Spirochaetes bacterium GWE1_60_18]OHD58587.1 MAG: riboflavin synthase subunit alpha [Spirochaetes bacterium GWF1_60_12]HAP44420.1 riboflavin synthase [Spirochaetaceae bacterium]